MVELVVCNICGRKIANNPMKHRSRKKFCPDCRTPYTKVGFKWKPNLDWIRKRLWQREERELKRQEKYWQRARHNLRLRFGREPSDSEIQQEMIWMMIRDGKLTEEDAEKKRWKLRLKENTKND